MGGGIGLITNCSDKGTVHGSFNEAEDMFHAASTL